LKALVELTLPEQPPQYTAFLVTSAVGKQGYDSAVAEAKDWLIAYYQLCDQLMDYLTDSLRDVSDSKVGQEARKQFLASFEEALKVIDTVSIHLYMATEDLLENIETIRAAIAYLKENPTVEDAKTKLAELRKVDYEGIMNNLHERVTQHAVVRLAQRLLAQTPALARAAAQPLPKPARRSLERAANAVYQQAVWSYNYWDVPRTAKQQLHRLLTAVQAVVEDEAQQALHALNPVKGFHFNHGDVMLAVELPAPVSRLDAAAATTQIAALKHTAHEVVQDLAAVKQIVEPIFFKANKTKHAPAAINIAQIVEPASAAQIAKAWNPRSGRF